MPTINTIDQAAKQVIQKQNKQGIVIPFQLSVTCLDGTEVALLSTGKLAKAISGATITLGVTQQAGAIDAYVPVLVNARSEEILTASAAFPTGTLLMNGALDADGRPSVLTATATNYAVGMAIEPGVLNAKSRVIKFYTPIKL